MGFPAQGDTHCPQGAMLSSRDAGRDTATAHPSHAACWDSSASQDSSGCRGVGTCCVQHMLYLVYEIHNLLGTGTCLEHADGWCHGTKEHQSGVLWALLAHNEHVPSFPGKFVFAEEIFSHFYVVHAFFSPTN